MVLAPPAGTALLFGGDVTHAGQPVAAGQRAVFVASFSRPYRGIDMDDFDPGDEHLADMESDDEAQRDLEQRMLAQLYR